MLNLSFVQDEELRDSLEKDFLEIEKAYENESWKAVHVLAGSIVEALLLETIISVDPSANRESLLKKALGDLISDSVGLDILSDKEEKLTTVLKDYRNLIHPGRVLRLQESVNKDSASICLSVVRIIASKLDLEQGKKIGYTAENVISKMQSDDGFPSIIDSILLKTESKEKFRLVADLLSEAISDKLRGGFDSNNADDYSRVYHNIVDDFDSKQIKQLEDIWIKEVESKEQEELEVYFTHLFSMSMILKFTESSQDVLIRYAANKYKKHYGVHPEIFLGFTFLPEYMVERVMNAIFYKVVNSTNDVHH